MAMVDTTESLANAARSRQNRVSTSARLSRHLLNYFISFYYSAAGWVFKHTLGKLASTEPKGCFLAIFFVAWRQDDPVVNLLSVGRGASEAARKEVARR